MAEKPQTEHLYSYNSPPPTYEESKYHQKLEEAPNLSAMDTEYTSQKAQSFQSQNAKQLPAYQPTMQQQHQRVIAVPPFYAGQQVYIPGAFDAGARFSNTSPPSIPPPPPGVAPNAAQIAAQCGSNVVTSQKKSSFW
ncbi:UNVERIFIED_CONTAM: hypothetical protein RMT77_012327 [Armadillidium vulgare]